MGRVSTYCATHDQDEPWEEGDYRACAECGHVWHTEADFVADVLIARAHYEADYVRYERAMPPDLAYPPQDEWICPLCTHDL
jgi:hypothetical protein